MTAYLNPDGSEIVVCDSCGIDHDGNKPDVSRLKKAFDDTDGLRQSLRAPSRERTEHFCHECGLHQEGVTPFEVEAPA